MILRLRVCLRKMDMLNADLHLKNQATASAKGQLNSSQEGGSEGGFHFIAFMPIMGMIWQLDGLQRQPRCLGKSASSWQPLRGSDSWL